MNSSLKYNSVTKTTSERLKSHINAYSKKKSIAERSLAKGTFAKRGEVSFWHNVAILADNSYMFGSIQLAIHPTQ